MFSRKRRLEGVVENFNLSPKGTFEGMLVQTAKELVQVNFPPEAGAAIGVQVPIGAEVKAVVEVQEDSQSSEHPVFDLVKIESPEGNSLSIGSKLERVLLEGKVSRLNYARHGERNGAVLENGDFVHLKPEGAKAIDLKLGIHLSVEGEVKPSYTASRVIEVEVVNGIRLKKHHAIKKKHGPKKHK